MNMIFNSPNAVANGTQTEDKTSASKAALAKLMAAWEAKQKSAKKVGGLGLLAVTLAACNDDDDAPAAAAPDTTPFSQADVDTQVAAAVAAVDTTADDAAAISSAVAAATSFSTLDELVAAYNTASNSGDNIMSTGIDYLTGAATDDTFVAVQTADTTETWGVADEIDGAGGTDTLKLTVAANEAINLGTLLNVENLVLRAAGGGTNDLDMANFATVTDLTLDRPVAGVDVTGLDTSDTVTVKDLLATTDTTLTYTTAGTAAALATAGDSATVTVNGATAASDLELAGDVETVTVNFSAASAFADLVFDGGTTTLTLDAAAATTVATTFTAAAVTSLTMSGAGLITVTPDLPAAVASITATGSTGGVNIDSGAVAEATNAVATFDQNDFTFTGGGGADTLDLASLPAARELTVDMGAGNDVVIVDEEVAADAATTTNAGDSINGGDGTDTIRYTASTTLDATHESQVTNFETLATGGTATITMANLDNFAAKAFSSSTSDGVDGNDRVVVSMDGMLTGSTFSADATAGTVTQSADADGVEFNFSLTTDDNSATATDSITISVAEGYEEISDDAEDDFEIVTLNVTGGTAAAGNTIEVVDFGNADTITINGTGAGTLTLSAITAQTTTAVVATGTTQAISPTFSTAIASYAGGSGVDTVVLAGGGLTSAKTFTDAGGATDSLSVTQTASQNAGIVAISGYETVSLTPDGGGDALTIDVRNVTGMTTLDLNGAHNSDTFTVNNIKTGTSVELSGGTTTKASVTTTVGDSATEQSFSATVAHTVTTLTVDAGTATATITSDDGDATADETMLVITTLAGGSLTTVTALGADDLTITNALPNTVTTFNASAATGQVNATGGTATIVMTGGNKADTLTGGSNATTGDTITGGIGADTISGGTGADRYVFESTGGATAGNGTDVLTLVAGAGGDILDFSAFLGAGTIHNTSGTTITAVAGTSTGDVDITNKLVMLNGGNTDNFDAASEIVTAIDGAGDALSITASGKGIVVQGDTTGANKEMTIFYVHDTNGDGDVADTDEVTMVATTTGGTGNVDVDTFSTLNFDVIA